MQHWWLDAVCNEWDVAIARKGEHITGVWPYAIASKLGVSLQRTPLFTPYLGPFVFFPNDIKASNRDGFEHDTIAALLKQLPESPVWFLTTQPGLQQAGLFNSQGLNVFVRQTFIINLQQDTTALLANMKEGLRRNIRTAEKELTIASDATHLTELYTYQQHTLRSKDVMQPYSLQQMQHLLDACMAHNASALWVAKKGGKTEAVVWNVWDAHTSYYLMGAQNPNSSGTHALSALLWHSMQEAKKRGNHSFDMEGSMDAGVERFFRSFGGQRTLYLTLRKNKSLIWKLKELFRG